MMSSRARSFLLATQNPDGGWGYAPGQASLVEATAAVVLALDDPAPAAERERALAWLQGGQHADGGWGLNHADTHSSWLTAWALLALARAGAAGGIYGRAIEWLLAAPILSAPQDDLQRGDVFRKLSIDASLRGWPWRPGEGSWVEPTSLAMLALQSVPAAASDPPVAARLAEAVRYLQDRRCRDGGWNFGNPYMVGAALPCRAHPTAWGILALTRRDPAAVQDADVAGLRHDMQADGGVLALAWGLLALRSRGLDDQPSASRLAVLQGEGGDWHNNPYQTALGLLVAERRAIV